MEIKYDFIDEDGNVVNTMSFDTEKQTKVKEEKNTGFLDISLIKDFREAINSSPFFMETRKQENRYSIICAAMDRIEKAVQVLNSTQAAPDKEEGLILYLVFACMIKDGIKCLHKCFGRDTLSCDEDKEFFIDVRDYNGNIFSEKQFATDDTFFEYYRSLAFAHPTGKTDKRKGRIFMQDGEEQCSPWVIACNSRFHFFTDLKNPIGIRIYSNKYPDGLKDIYFSFNCLQGYIKKRYDLLKELTEWAKDEIKDQEDIWKSQKIKRSDDAIETLKNAMSILESRFETAGDIEELIEYLSCETTLKRNKENVAKYRDAIKEIIPHLCDCIDKLDYDGMSNAILSVEQYPKNVHQMFYYQMEKIFNYLREKSDVIEEGSNEQWGLIQAEEFADSFAKKWVCIKPYEMSYEEIKLLVRVACYCEWLEEKGEEKTKNG